jgi:multidrug efflux pump subunit AcrB
MMAARLLRREAEVVHGRLHRTAGRLFDGMLRAYSHGLRWVLRHRRLTLGITVASAVVTVALYVVVPKGLFPRQDTGQVRGFSDAPQDISFPAMRDHQRALDKAVLAHPAVEHVTSFVGAGGHGAINTSEMHIQLKPFPPRKIDADQVIAQLRPRVTRVPGVALYLQARQDVRLGGRMSRTEYQYTLQHVDLATLNEWAPRVLQRLRRLPQLRDVASDQQTGGRQLVLDLDRDTASRLGVLPKAIEDTLYDAFGQRQVATIYTQVAQYRVVLEVKPELQLDPTALERIFVKSTSGAQVPLAAIARSSAAPAALSVNHQGQFPAVTISFNLSEGASLGEAVDAIHAAEQELGLPPGVRAAFQGSAQAFKDSLANTPLLILAALLAVYIVLGVLYESLVHPITILSTLPSAGVGALLALLAAGAEFTIIALIGIVLLIGIVQKNAIMMIDFALEVQRAEGLSSAEAIYRACVLRFRPIMMTTMAALLVSLPLALSSGVGSELRRPLGIAIVGGLIFSQVLTLFTTPVVYLALDRFARHSREHRATD